MRAKAHGFLRAAGAPQLPGSTSLRRCICCGASEIGSNSSSEANVSVSSFYSSVHAQRRGAIRASLSDTRVGNQCVSGVQGASLRRDLFPALPPQQMMQRYLHSIPSGAASDVKGTDRGEKETETPWGETEGHKKCFVGAALSIDKCVVLHPPSDIPGGPQRREQIRLGHPWLFDYEIGNIRFLTKEQTGQLLPVYDNDGEYLGSGLFSRQASVAVRMMTFNKNTDTDVSSSSTSIPKEGSIGPLLHSRFIAALQRRGFPCKQQEAANSGSTSSSASSSIKTYSSSSSASIREEPSVWRAVDGEADRLPGMEVDVYGSAVVVRIQTQALVPHIPQLVSLVEETMNPDTLCLQQLQSKKEKLAQGGAEYHSELLRGSDPEVWVENIGNSGVRLPIHLYLPPFAAFATHLIPLVPLLRRHCAGGSLLTVDGSMRAIGVPCLRGVGGAEELRKADSSGSLGEAEEDWGHGADSLVMVETSKATNALNERAAAANGVMAAVSCIYAEDAAKELSSMKNSGLRFRGVYVHFHPNVRFAASERGGQFGRWFRPSLRGIESQWAAAASLVEKGGLLLTSLLLPVHQGPWAMYGLRRAAETAGRSASLIYSSAATSNAR